MNIIKDKKIHEVQTKQKHSLVYGSIDICNAYIISGWIYSPTYDVHPVLTQNGIPLRCLNSNKTRADVSKNLGISESNVGFEFELSSMNEDDELILYGASKDDLIFVSKVCLEKFRPEKDFFNQLQNAIEISKIEDSVAITCWDSFHNPVGRAKVLYEIIKNKTNPLLVSYTHKEFGSSLWKPIISSKINHLQIPWDERDKYEKYIQKSDLSFDTVWICKNRYPSFLLAKLISHSRTSIVLDIDDMESEFSQSDEVKHKAYGRLTNNISRYYTNLISARTSPSISLSNHYSSNIVRHTRLPIKKSEISEVVKDKSSIDLVFIGTVRKHKNIIEIAKTIQEINQSSDISYKFHIYGDIPKDERIQLNSLGSKTFDVVQTHEIPKIISKYDICISGYPDTDDRISKYQISSKIGDALAANKPILVPYSESVKDLDKVNGIFLYNKDNFNEVLIKIASSKLKIVLPDQFNTLKNYKNFENIKKISQSSPRADVIFNNNNLKPSIGSDSALKNVLFFWKQGDAGIYGRRIDIVARDFKKNNPHINVFIIEIRQKNDNEKIINQDESFFSDFKFVNENLSNKVHSYHVQDNVNYSTLIFDKLNNLETNLSHFLLDNHITPENSSLVLFPHIKNLEIIMKVIKSFKIIVDVVDNQLEWESDKSKPQLLAQLKVLFNIAKAVVFNSEINYQYFKENGFINESVRTEIIKNWYNLPPLFLTSSLNKNEKQRQLKNIFYSGNLKERFDWSLLFKVALQFPKLNIHLVGTSSVDIRELDSINQYKNIIYHGPLKEEETLKLLSSMDLALMPHIANHISQYMNPLKILMYKTIGIKTIAMSVEGILKDKDIIIVDSYEDFILEIENNRLIQPSKMEDNDYSKISLYEELLKS